MKNTKHILFLSLTACVTFSCTQPEKQHTAPATDEKIEITGNKTVTTSTDKEKLRRLLDLSKYEPTAVKFQYTFYDNSGKNERLTVPGPSDYFLCALLYFDSLTMEKFYEFDRNADYSDPGYNKEEFAFDWLPKEVTDELMNSDSSYHGHPEFFFGTNGRGKAWYLKNKILLYTSSEPLLNNDFSKNISVILNDTITINKQQLVHVSGSIKNEADHFLGLITLAGDTVVKFEDFYHKAEFMDIDGDGYKDIRVFIYSNTPNQCDNYLFDKATKSFRFIEDCWWDITLVKGTKLFYNDTRAGCAAYNRESELVKIENWKAVLLGRLLVKDCDREDDGLYIYKVNGDKEELVKSLPVPKEKWTFFKKYWTANYKLFE